MAPPTKLTIATAALTRLIKEEASYHKELAQQQSRIASLEAANPAEQDENADFQLRQERRALEETKAVLPSLRSKIERAVVELRGVLEENRAQVTPEEIAKAEDAVALGVKAVQETAEK